MATKSKGDEAEVGAMRATALRPQEGIGGAAKFFGVERNPYTRVTHAQKKLITIAFSNLLVFTFGRNLIHKKYFLKKAEH